ncbi:putative nucleic-acid-binding protein, contains PIN domain containing protein [Bradyrhizobium sp. YR681]|uniref:PIN domain-containing protein n=1 Tax=Bradyrhizobium sp. YR681 TaxID=1144344 RepID=UPI00026F6C19|nr:PIN domain-containing protein [Bradyrhizobium sp. YR681]EJN07088.1 putative nucleic-acid-binding protein, contains PIN domain containing protein [Bradyrhizobium sp. YR681]
MSAFLDTNILVYAQQTGTKATISRDLIEQGGAISAQVLNELANVLHRKQGRSWRDIELLFDDIDNTLDPALPLTAKTSRAALALVQNDGFAFYEALIVAAAIEAGCDILYTEDMQHGRSIGGLTIVNPFLGSASPSA